MDTPAKTALQIFDELQDLPDEQRLAHLQQMQLPEELRLEVEKMLHVSDHAEHFLEQPAQGVMELLHGKAPAQASAETVPPGSASSGLLDSPAAPEISGPHPINVPGYQLLREISRGGQAVVFEAIQHSTSRRVAVKVMREGPLASPRERARFDREVQVLAALSHPNIVQVLDRGTTSDGSTFLAMEYISGRPLDQWLDAYYQKYPDGPPPDDPSELLRLFLKICDAVNAAHLRGIVHRDLKPSNIRIDDDGQPHVLDFGLAHTGFVSMTDEQEPQPVSISGQFLGSLPWASPEQAEGISSKIDTRTDVYSLGVILYQMLTGRFPYEVAGTMRDVLNNIITSQPSPPSAILEGRDAKQARKATMRRRRRGHSSLNSVIDAIVLKSLAKQREERYQSAGELARDIANYLSGRPTLAAGEPPRSPWTRVAAIIGGAAACVALGVGISWILLAKPSLTPEAPRAERASSLEQQQPAKPQAEPSVERVAESTDPISRMALAARPAGIKGLRGWSVETINHRGPICAMGYSPDGKYLATAGADGAVRVWDAAPAPAAQRPPLRRLLLAAHARIECLAWPARGSHLAAATNDAIFVFDVSTGRLVRKAEKPKDDPHLRVGWIDMSPDGSKVAIGRADGLAGLLDIASGRMALIPTTAPTGWGVTPVSWSPDGKWIAKGGAGNPVLLDPGGVQQGPAWPKTQAPCAHVTGIAWSPDGTTLAVSDTPDKLYFWKPATGEVVAGEPEMAGAPNGIVWSPDGKRILSRADGMIIFEAATGKKLKKLEPACDLAAWSPDGTTITGATGSIRPVWRLYDGTTAQALATFASYPEVTGNEGFGWSSVDAKLVVNSYERQQIWETDRGELVQCLEPVKPYSMNAIVWSPDGRAIAATFGHGILGLWHSSGSRIGILDGAEIGPVVHAWSPDGQSIASCGRQQSVIEIRTVATNQVRRRLEAKWSPEFPPAFAFSPDGTTLAGACEPNLVKLWDMRQESQPAKELAVNGLAIHGVFSPDGQRLALAVVNVYGLTGHVEIWDTASLQQVHTSLPDTPPVARLAYSRDGATLFTITRGGRLAARDASDGRVLYEHDGLAVGSFSFDGQRLAAGRSDLFHFGPESNGTMVRIWDTATGKPLRTIVPLHDEAGLTVSADGHLATFGAPADFAENQLVYVAMSEVGEQALWSPSEFAKEFGWKNDPKRIITAVQERAAAPPVRESQPQPPVTVATDPLSPLALVARPAAIQGLRGWSVETVSHRGSIAALAYSPDGQWLATGGLDGALRLWNVKDRQDITSTTPRIFLDCGAPIELIAWPAKGPLLAAASSDGIFIFDAPSGRLLRRIAAVVAPAWVRVSSMDWSPDGSELAYGLFDGEIHRVDVSSGKVDAIDRRNFTGLTPVSWSPRGDWLAVGGGRGPALLTHPSTGEAGPICPLEPGVSYGVRWSPDGSTLAIRDERGLHFWNPSSGTVVSEQREAGAEPAGHHIAWAPDGRRVVAAGASVATHIIDSATGKRLSTLSGTCVSVAWSMDAAIIALVTLTLPRSLEFYDAATAKRFAVLEPHPQIEGNGGVAFSRDANKLALLASGMAQIWDAQRGELTRCITAQSLNGLAWAPDARSLITASSSGRVELWDSSSGNALWDWHGEGEGGVGAFAWSPAGQKVACFGQVTKKVYILDASSGGSLQTLEMNWPEACSPALAFSPDGATLAGGAGMGIVRLWDMRPTPQPARDLSIAGLAVDAVFAPDGKRLALAVVDTSDARRGNLELWDLASDHRVYRSIPEVPPVLRLAYAADGQTLYTITRGGRLTARDATDGRLLREHHGLQVGSLSPDGRRLATGKMDLIGPGAGGTSLRIWDTATGKPLRTMVPLHDEAGLAVSADGHVAVFGDSADSFTANQLVYVALTESGEQHTFTPAQFSEKFGWKNDRKYPAPHTAATTVNTGLTQSSQRTRPGD